ncbi:unnamed protein product [Periconia digitata]|uniref:RRM domain-containing protein n=1 Tax=Periconia digitata TaxID=1303443 RepID=A0A9W4USC3_9PLEO|nr:unnamed protein product [Periconia digitata]
MAETSLADIVKAARDRKKREAIAQQFLGSQARKANASGSGAGAARPRDQKPTLLSRTSGIQKQRSSSARPAASIDGKWQHDLHRENNPNGPGPKRLNRTASSSQIDRNTRSFDRFTSNLGKNAQNARDNNDGPGFNIKGVASRGPYTIVASNFAQGTTGSDIEQVMAPHGHGSFLSARVITPGPTVMAEIDFETKDGADNVIQIFNGKKADGKVLYVYHKNNTSALHARPSTRAPQQSFDDMDVDMNGGGRNGGFQDGRFGFPDNQRGPPRGPRRRY